MAELTLERKLQLLLETQVDLYTARVLDLKEGESADNAVPKKELELKDLERLELIARIGKVLRMKAEVGAEAVRVAQKVNTAELLKDLKESRDPDLFPRKGRPTGPRQRVGDVEG